MRSMCVCSLVNVERILLVSLEAKSFDKGENEDDVAQSVYRMFVLLVDILMTISITRKNAIVVVGSDGVRVWFLF